MKKFIVLIVLSLFVNIQVYAQDSNELLERFKQHRASIYASLNLTNEQAAKINEIDSRIYTELEPEFKEVSLQIKRIDDIANSDDCTVKKVNAVKKDFKSVEKRISEKKHSYEKEFKQVLTPEQKTAYKTAKKEFRIQHKKEIQKLKKSLKNN